MELTSSRFRTPESSSGHAHETSSIHEVNVPAVRESVSVQVKKTTLVCNELILGWLEKHSKPYVDKRKDSTFKDNKGVRRYLESWQVVADDPEIGLTSEDKKGVLRVYFEGKGKDTRYIKFLANWEKLWKSYEEDPDDEIAAQAPLLRIFIEFFFHRRTCHLFVVFFLYDVFLVTAIALTANNPFGTTSTVANLALQFIQAFIYLALKKVYTGCFVYEYPEPTADIPASVAERHKKELEKMHTRRTTSKKYSVHWLSTIKQLCVRSADEFRGIFRKGIVIEQRAKKENYYNLINTALKFLVHHSDTNPARMDFNRLQYRLALLFVLIVVPVYTYYEYIYKNLAQCGLQLHQSGYCDFIYYYAIESGLGFTVFMQTYIFIGSVLVGFVGLAYGGEIAFQLTNSWLQRFGDLRRVTCAVDGEVVQEGVEAMFHASPGAQCSSSSSKRARESECMEAERETAELTDEDFSLRISRDAFEQHLFFSAYMKRAGSLWSPIIACQFVYFLYLCSGILYFLIADKEARLMIAENLTYLGIRFLTLFVYPVTSLAHANRYLYAVYDTFMMAAPTDYAILGGKENWTTFLTAVPAVWTFFGLWITWDRIFATLWTLLSAAIAIGVTMVSSSL